MYVLLDDKNPGHALVVWHDLPFVPIEGGVKYLLINKFILFLPHALG